MTKKTTPLARKAHKILNNFYTKINQLRKKRYLLLAKINNK